MTFTAQSLHGSWMNWNGQATATVTVTLNASAQDNIIYLFEKGQFCPNATTNTIPFRNTFKLVCHPDHIAFYHERFGADNPVWLFDLVATDHDTLKNKTIHQCAQDQYSVLVSLNEKNIEMTWHIIGPKKNEKIHYHYF